MPEMLGGNRDENRPGKERLYRYVFRGEILFVVLEKCVTCDGVSRLRRTFVPRRVSSVRAAHFFDVVPRSDPSIIISF